MEHQRIMTVAQPSCLLILALLLSAEVRAISEGIDTVEDVADSIVHLEAMIKRVYRWPGVGREPGHDEALECVASFFCPKSLLPQQLSLLMRSLSQQRDDVCSKLVCLSCGPRETRYTEDDLPSRQPLSQGNISDQCHVLREARKQLCTIRGLATQLNIHSWSGDLTSDMISVAYKPLQDLSDQFSQLEMTDTDFEAMSVCDPRRPHLWDAFGGRGTTFNGMKEFLASMASSMSDILMLEQAASHVHCASRKLDEAISSVMNTRKASRSSLFLPIAGILCQASLNNHTNQSNISLPQSLACHQLAQLQKAARLLLGNETAFRMTWLLGTLKRLCSTHPANISTISSQLIKHEKHLVNQVMALCQSTVVQTWPCTGLEHAPSYIPNAQSQFLCLRTTCPSPTVVARINPQRDKPYAFIEHLRSSLATYFNCSNMSMATSQSSSPPWACQLSCHYDPQQLQCQTALRALMLIKIVGLLLCYEAYLTSCCIVMLRYGQNRLSRPDLLMLFSNGLLLLDQIVPALALYRHHSLISCRHDQTPVRSYLDYSGLCALDLMLDDLLYPVQVAACIMLVFTWMEFAKAVHKCVQQKARKTRPSLSNSYYMYYPLVTLYSMIFPVIRAWTHHAPLRANHVLKTCAEMLRPIFPALQLLLALPSLVGLYHGGKAMIVTANAKRNKRDEMLFRKEYCSQRPMLQYIVVYYFYLMMTIGLRAIKFYNLQEEDPATLKEQTNDYVACHATNCNTTQCPTPHIRAPCWVGYMELSLLQTYLALLLILLPYKNDFRRIAHKLVEWCKQQRMAKSERRKKTLKPLSTVHWLFANNLLAESTKYILSYERRRQQRVQRNERLQHFRQRQKQKLWMDRIKPRKQL